MTDPVTDSPTPTTSAALEIKPCSPADDAARDALVRATPGGSFFHLSGWRSFVANLYHHEAHELAAWRGGELVGVLPMMLSPGLFGANHLVSMPFGVYGGPVAADAGVRRALVDEAKALADRMRVRHLELRFLDDPELDLPGTDLYWTFLRDLPEDPDDVLKGMPKKSRAEARKAQNRHGLVLEEGVWYTDDLYRLFLNNKHSLGSPSLPPEHFHRLLDELGDSIYVHLVRRGSEPLAAVMSFAFEGTLIAYYAGTAPGADRAYSASNFMYMKLQEWAVKNGFERFDFCRSRGDSGAFQFKVHQGFEPTPLHYRFHLVRASAIPSFNPSNPKTALLRKTWTKLPLWLVRRLSRRLAPRLG